MKDEQFEKLMEKLEEIRCGIIDVEDSEFKSRPTEVAYTEQIIQIQTAFYHQLEAKTGWGRNEIKSLFEAAVESAL